MKKLYILAALFMATTSAHAGGNGISLEIGGQRVYIEASRNCDSLSCIKITAPGLSGSSFGKSGGFNDDDDFADRKDTPSSNSAQSNSGYGKYNDGKYGEGKYNDGKYNDGKYGEGKYNDGKYSDGKSKRYNDDDYADRNDNASSSGYGKYNGSRSKRYNDDNYADRNDTPSTSAPAGNSGYNRYNGYRSKRYGNDGYAGDRNDAPASSTAPAPTQATAPQPVAPAANAAPAPAQTTVASNAPATNDSVPQAQAPAANAASAPQQAPVAAAPASDPTSPLGVWATEEGKGNVSIEPCGANLCGYAVKTGEKILINMKEQGSKWTGRIHDPDSGRNYDSTIAMKGTNSLRVQGCAFGGMFCGGQTWKRVS